MECNFENERPIYIQLTERIMFEIISGQLKSGDRIPSVRELAVTAKVNPNTVQKALLELENKGLIYTARTNGKFVTDNVELIENAKKEIANEKANKYLEDMNSIGISYKQAIKYLQELGGNK